MSCDRAATKPHHSLNLITIQSIIEAVELDTWREYTLLRIDKNIDFDLINMLKMTCPSTRHIHFLRVPPEITSAKEAIKWVNWGVLAEDFSVQT